MDKVSFVKPAEIEAESMRIIGEELKDRGIILREETSFVVKRVIHATADFDFAEELMFTPGAVPAGISALQAGVPVITDTNMALSGVSAPGLSRLGGEKFCFMADDDIAFSAKERGITRAAASMEKAAGLYPGGIYAVGNAPTALFEIVRQMERGLRPALVIAVPVGFVNVVEAKKEVWDACVSSGFPCIAAMGRKGGSSVAAAILNALIYKAA